jgi:cathepsin B
LVACNFENFGCSGGLLVNTVDFLQTEGVASEECMPYQDIDTTCSFKCIDPTKQYTKYYCKSGSLKILSDYEEIQRELFTNGPLMVGLSVYEDFTSYKNGTYKHVAGDMVGGHAIKMIGWGHDESDGSLFWVCQNQWSEAWGMDGYINVKAGEIGLDSMAVGCDPDISEL